MILYFFILLFFLTVGSKQLSIANKPLFQYAKEHNRFIFLLLAIFLCGGYMTGSDWRSYEISYIDADWSNLNYYLNEKSFYVLMILSKYIVNDFFTFLILSKFLVFYAILNFLQKFSPNIFISSFFYIPLFGIFLFIDNPLRYMIALGFITISYRYLLDKKFFKFIILVLVASQFHITVLIFIPFYFLKKINISRFLLSIIFLCWMFFFKTEHFFFLINIFNNYIPNTVLSFSNYIIAAISYDQVFSIGLIMNVVFFFWIIFYKNEIKNNLKYGEIFYSMSIIYLFFTKLSVIFPTAFRFSYLFAPFFIITLTYVFLRNKNIYKKFFSAGIVIYIFLFTHQKINNHYVYIPYTNYFTFVITDNLINYYERSKHNLTEFYKRKGYYYYSK